MGGGWGDRLHEVEGGFSPLLKKIFETGVVFVQFTSIVSTKPEPQTSAALNSALVLGIRAAEWAVTHSCEQNQYKL